MRSVIACSARRAIFIAISFVFVFLAGCTQIVNLQTGLHDADANEIVALLRRYGIETTKIPTKEGITLTVKTSDIARATDVMQAAGLPRRNLSNLGDMFKKEGMISTPLEERVRYIHGLSQELEYTLQQFDNVISARVHVVLPERVAPGEPIQPSSAAVFIKYKEPFDADMNIPRIRNLVASSIPGLAGVDQRSKVSVVVAPGAIDDHPIDWIMVGPFRVDVTSASMLTTVLYLGGFWILLSMLYILFRAALNIKTVNTVMRNILPKSIGEFMGVRYESTKDSNKVRVKKPPVQHPAQI